MSEVVNELRPGNQSVVKESISEHNAVDSEVHRMNKHLSTMNEKWTQTMNEKLAQMEHKHQKNCADLKSDWKSEIESLEESLVHGMRSHILHELITIRQEFSSMKQHFDEIQAEVRRKVPIGPVVPGQEVQREREEAPLEFVHVPICSKPTCKNSVVDTFRSGRCMKQCRGCRGHH
jgi:predicted  nucleic acid-binding Zn-ribbon protein